LIIIVPVFYSIAAMKIQISQETKSLLDKQEGSFTCEKRGAVDIKGKGV